jgi:hypothetical protein
MGLRACRRCGTTAGDEGFYESSPLVCKECVKANAKARYYRDAAKVAAYERERARRPERRAARVRYLRKLRKANPEKYRAWTAVGNAIRDGRLKRGRCVYCGVEKAQAHHTDYSKPLDVVWVCFMCHRQVEHGQECHDGDAEPTPLHCHDEPGTMPDMASKKGRVGNPRDSEWFSTPNAARGRPKVQITVDPETLETMDRLAAEEGRSKGAVVDDAIRDYDRKQSKKK